MPDPQSGIWSLEEAAIWHLFDESLAAEIVRSFADYSPRVADLGCGPGHYCAELRAAGFPVVVGFEGTRLDENMAEHKPIIKVDLSRYFRQGVTYDLVLCLEVAEHIPAEREACFLDNVAAFVGDWLIFSWALPGQGGLGHVNERSNFYAIEQLNSRGFELRAEPTEHFRTAATFPYFKQTLLVFEQMQ